MERLAQLACSLDCLNVVGASWLIMFNTKLVEIFNNQRKNYNC